MVLALYKTHFYKTGNFHVNLNSPGAAEFEEICSSLYLKNTSKMIFPNDMAKIPKSHTPHTRSLMLHYIREILYKSKLFSLISYSKEDFKIFVPLTHTRKIPSKLFKVMVFRRQPSKR